MNIFVTSECPVQSAKFLDTKRVNKMILESAQMLSTAINLCGGNAPYRSTHPNHPANVWCRTTKGNWDWLYAHYVALGLEYTKRTGKIHKSSTLQQTLLQQRHLIPDGKRMPFVNCARNKDLGFDFTHIQDVHAAYQLYLSSRWETDKREPVWS